MEDINEDIVDLMDLVNFTTSDDFMEKWRYRFSPPFIKLFQEKLIESLKKQKPIKKKALTTFFTKRYKYSLEEVENFYEAIDISLYRPIIS